MAASRDDDGTGTKYHFPIPKCFGCVFVHPLPKPHTHISRSVESSQVESGKYHMDYCCMYDVKANQFGWNITNEISFHRMNSMPSFLTRSSPSLSLPLLLLRRARKSIDFCWMCAVCSAFYVNIQLSISFISLDGKKRRKNKCQNRFGRSSCHEHASIGWNTRNLAIFQPHFLVDVSLAVDFIMCSVRIK